MAAVVRPCTPLAIPQDRSRAKEADAGDDLGRDPAADRRASWTIAIDIIVKTADPMPNEDVRPEAGALAMQLAFRADHPADRCRQEQPPDDFQGPSDR